MSHAAVAATAALAAAAAAREALRRLTAQWMQVTPVYCGAGRIFRQTQWRTTVSFVSFVSFFSVFSFTIGFRSHGLCLSGWIRIS